MRRSYASALDHTLYPAGYEARLEERLRERAGRLRVRQEYSAAGSVRTVGETMRNWGDGVNKQANQLQEHFALLLSVLRDDYALCAISLTDEQWVMRVGMASVMACPPKPEPRSKREEGASS